MQEQQFLIKDFELFSARNDRALLYTPELSAHITHAKVFELLTQLNTMKKCGVTEAQLDQLIVKFSLDVNAVKKYLVRHIKILVPQNAADFKKLFLVIENESIRSVLQKHFRDGHGVSVYTGNDFSAVDADSLILFFRSHYLPQDFEQIQLLSVERDAWLISSYIANEYLLIDNIYQASKGVPCHFCNYYRHQNVVMSTNNVKKTSWINFCRKAITEEVAFFPAISLSEIENAAIVYWLAKTIKNYIGTASSRLFMNETTQYSWINLLTGEKNQEQAVHWSFCECLQKEAI